MYVCVREYLYLYACVCVSDFRDFFIFSPIISIVPAVVLPWIEHKNVMIGLHFNNQKTYRMTMKEAFPPLLP